MTIFMFILLIQLFYAISITTLTRVVPPESLSYVTSFSDLADDIDMIEVSQDIQDSLDSQLNIPLIELGALVFYSGNILVDLMLNFFFAVPQMITIFINALAMLFNFDAFILGQVQLFFMILVTLIYFLGMISMVIGIRSGNIAS